jgi:gas vesicle protein
MATFSFGKSEVALRRKNHTFTALGYMVAGLGIGAIAGILTAPKSGKQTRKDVGRKLEDARDAMENFSKQAGELWERGEELAEAARRKAEPVARYLRRGA